MASDKVIIKYVHLVKPYQAVEKDGTTWICGRVPPVGVVMATSPDNIGWSLCNIAKGDQFRKATAKESALLRAVDNYPLPEKLTAVGRTDLYEVFDEVKELASRLLAK